MLETRTPPLSPRTRRLDAPPRPAAAREPAARGRSFAGNTALDTSPAPRPAPTPRPTRLGRSEMRLMGLATTCTAIVCGLLLLYLAAYAHVSQLGYAQAQARSQLRQNRLRNESLRAERDRLQSRTYVLQEALALGMKPRGATPVTYVTAPPADQKALDKKAPEQTTEKSTDMAANAEQGTYGGTTADGSGQQSLDH